MTRLLVIISLLCLYLVSLVYSSQIVGQNTRYQQNLSQLNSLTIKNQQFRSQFASLDSLENLLSHTDPSFVPITSFFDLHD